MDRSAPRSSYVAPKPVLDPSGHPTFADLLEAAARAFPDQDAFVQGPLRISFRQWLEQADALAGALQAKGLQAGDVLLISLKSSIEYAVCCAAAQLAGAIGSGINTRLGPREVAAIVERSGARFLILEDQAQLPPAGPVVVRRAELAALGQATPLGVARPRRASSDPSVIIWTSGTTGLPKGAWFDHAALAAAVTTSGPMAAPFARRLHPTPFAHAGFMSKIWELVAYGLTTVISPPPWSAGQMLKSLVDERINISSGVPTQWAKLLELPEIDTADLSNLRIAFTASAPVPPPLAEKLIAKLGCPLIVRYSMTECPSVCGTFPGDDAEVLFRTVGRPQPGVEVLIADDEGQPVEAGSVGRIRVRWPGMMRGYWRDPERTAEAMTPDGWLLTGDYGRWASGGNVVLAGRTSEMYIRGGYNVYPIEVERALGEHPKVAAAAVVGRPAPVIGEIGVAFVTPADPASPPDLEELRAWTRSKLADYKAPDELHILDELPRNSMMKVDKQALKKRLGAGPTG